MKPGDADAVEQVADEAAAADHRARGDRRAGVGEGVLEHPVGEQRHAGGAVGRRQACSMKNRWCRSTACPGSNMKAKPHGPEGDAADAGIGDAFDQDVDRLTRAGEARLEHHEADLHAEHEEGGDQRPHRVDRVDVSVAATPARRPRMPARAYTISRQGRGRCRGRSSFPATGSPLFCEPPRRAIFP